MCKYKYKQVCVSAQNLFHTRAANLHTVDIRVIVLRSSIFHLGSVIIIKYKAVG